MVSSPFQNTQNTYFGNYLIFNYNLPPAFWITQFQADLCEACISREKKQDPLPSFYIIPQSPWDTKVPWNKPPYSLPSDEVCGPWGAQQGRKQPKLCPCNHFSRNHHSCHSWISCVHCTSYFVEFSNPWYRLILPSACVADYRNLIHRRKGDSERLHDLPKGTQQQNGNARIHTDILWSQEQPLMVPTPKQPPHQNELMN